MWMSSNIRNEVIASLLLFCFIEIYKILETILKNNKISYIKEMEYWIKKQHPQGESILEIWSHLFFRSTENTCQSNYSIRLSGMYTYPATSVRIHYIPCILKEGVKFSTRQEPLKRMFERSTGGQDIISVPMLYTFISHCQSKFPALHTGRLLSRTYHFLYC